LLGGFVSCDYRERLRVYTFKLNKFVKLVGKGIKAVCNVSRLREYSKLEVKLLVGLVSKARDKAVSLVF
jgi:hypothetical protein